MNLQLEDTLFLLGGSIDRVRLDTRLLVWLIFC